MHTCLHTLEHTFHLSTVQAYKETKMDQIKQGSNSRVEYTVAGNMGNMIAQLSLQVANLQTALQQKNKENDQLRAEAAELKHQIDNLRGRENNGKRPTRSAD